MKTHTRLLGVAAALLALGAMAFGAMEFTIKRTPKEGEVLKYKLKAELDLSGTSVTVTGNVIEKTIKVEADGKYTVESSQTDSKVTFGGQEMPVPEQGADVSVYSALGELLETRGPGAENPNARRISNMNEFVQPAKAVNVGDTWSKEIKADEKTGAVAATATYKVEGEEKIGAFDVLKISVNFKETGSDPATLEGSFFLNKADWTMVKFLGTYKNTPFPGAPGPANASFELLRSE